MKPFVVAQVGTVQNNKLGYRHYNQSGSIWAVWWPTDPNHALADLSKLPHSRLIKEIDQHFEADMRELSLDWTAIDPSQRPPWA